jgi:hypothetical protein
MAQGLSDKGWNLGRSTEISIAGELVHRSDRLSKAERAAAEAVEPTASASK